VAGAQARRELAVRVVVCSEDRTVVRIAAAAMVVTEQAVQV